MIFNQFGATPRQPILVGFLLSTLGIVTLTICAISYQKTRTFIATANTADGTVIEMKRNDKSSYPIVRFTTETGETIEFRSNVGSNPPAYRIGDTVSILYPADTPQKATINSFPSLWLLLLIFTVFGSGFTLSGFSTLWWKLTGK